MKKVWRFLEADSQPVEVVTALGCVSMSASAVIATSSWLPWPILAWGWMVFATVHLGVTLSANTRLRQLFALLSVLVFGALAAMTLSRDGWSSPAAPALMVATLSQFWAFLAIESDRVDAVRRKECRR